jgi:hypothetical protein
MTTITTNSFRFWFKKGIMLRRAVAFGWFPVELSLRHNITHKLLGTKAVTSKVELRYKTDALGTATSNKLQQSVQDQIIKESGKLLPSHVLFICNRCKNITHPYIMCPDNPIIANKQRKKARFAMVVKETADLQQEMLRAAKSK